MVSKTFLFSTRTKFFCQCNLWCWESQSVQPSSTSGLWSVKVCNCHRCQAFWVSKCAIVFVFRPLGSRSRGCLVNVCRFECFPKKTYTSLHNLLFPQLFGSLQVVLLGCGAMPNRESKVQKAPKVKKPMEEKKEKKNKRKRDRNIGSILDWLRPFCTKPALLLQNGNEGG